jgi:hypothetical protein
MSDKFQVIEYDWPKVEPWPSLQKFIGSNIRDGVLIPIDGPVQVTTIFKMLQSDIPWHTTAPYIETLITKLIFCLHESGIVYDTDIVRLNVDKVVPGPAALKIAPGIRISILALE